MSAPAVLFDVANGIAPLTLNEAAQCARSWKNATLVSGSSPGTLRSRRKAFGIAVPR